jgi:DNA adenine methylase
MSVKKLVLKYYGSKFRLAHWIISFFPAHRHYVEPFAGGASVLLVKEPSRLETINDLNCEIVNFFRVLRECPEELVRQVKLTPWARSEFNYCLEEIEVENPVERARRFFFRIWMNLQGSMVSQKANFRRHNKGTKVITKSIDHDNLFDASKRLRSVLIENRDAFKLIREMDSEDTLFYLDPPYVFSTRSTSKAYSHEMTDDNHREFAELLYSVKGFVILSGYPSKIYEELFEARGWLRFDKDAWTMRGTKKTECVWINPQAAKALNLLPHAVINH